MKQFQLYFSVIYEGNIKILNAINNYQKDISKNIFNFVTILFANNILKICYGKRILVIYGIKNIDIYE